MEAPGGGGEKRKEGADYEEEGVELHLDGVVAGVQIVMLEKLDCILSKRATRPVYI